MLKMLNLGSKIYLYFIIIGFANEIEFGLYNTINEK